MIKIYEALGMEIKIWHGNAEHDFLLQLSNILSVRLLSKTAQTMSFTEIVDSNIGNAITNYCYHLPEPSFFFNKNNNKLVCFSAGSYTVFQEKRIIKAHFQNVYNLELLSSKKSTDSWEICFFDKQEGIITVLDSSERTNIKELLLLDSFSFLCEDKQLVGYSINLKNYHGKLWSDKEADFLHDYLEITITSNWDDEAQEKVACNELHKLCNSYEGMLFTEEIFQIKEDLLFFQDD